MDQKTINRAQYLAWLKQTAPPLYYNMLRETTSSAEYSSHALSGFWDSAVDVFSDFTKNVSAQLPALATAYAGYQTQKDIIALNTQRAQQGLAPLTYNSAGQLVAPQVDYTSEQLRIAQTAQSQNNMMIFVMGFALLLVVIATRK